MIRRFIPNLITLCNLLCGVIAVYMAATGRLTAAALFICGGILFDFFDGMAARLLGVSSDLGKELDSLADIVTSGLAPSFILLTLSSAGAGSKLSLLALLMPLFAAYRLAKFNLDTRQSHSFLGLPVPSNALIWVGLALSLSAEDPLLQNRLFALALLALSLLTDILMVSELPLFSLKVNLKDLSLQSNRVQYLFLLGCLILIAAVRNWYALSLIILWYILLSLFTQRHSKNAL